MHRMNANRVTDGGTSTLDDASLNRIRDRVGKAADRRAEKHQRVASVKKTAKKEESTLSEVQSTTKHIVVASLSDIPADFERIGTGFFRQGHHLWEMIPGEGGFVLVRKRGEDHVLGFSPEPVLKSASIMVTDRNGVELKQGSRVTLPHRGKIAGGTIIVLTPETLGVGLDGGERVDVPSDMVEAQPEGDKQAGDVFEPEISAKPKSDYVGPQTSQVGSGGVSAQNTMDGSRNVMASKKKAQTAPVVETPAQPASPAAPPQQMSEPEAFQPMDSRLVEAANNGPVGLMTKDGMGPYLVTKVSDNQYKIEIIQTKKLQADTVDANGLAEFDRNLGQWYEMPHVTKLARTASRELVIGVLKDLSRTASIDMKEWKEYWQAVGSRIAENVPPKPPKPKMTEAEKKEKARQRREERALERKGLPKGVKLPPKGGAKHTDELGRMKEYTKILEQAIDGIGFAIESVGDPNDDVLVADAVAQELERFEQEKAEFDKQNQDGMEDELSLEEPSQMEMDGIDITRSSNRKQANKVVVSMSDL